jgi:hypothetical protein
VRIGIWPIWLLWCQGIFPYLFIRHLMPLLLKILVHSESRAIIIGKLESWIPASIPDIHKICVGPYGDDMGRFGKTSFQIAKK